VDGDDLLVAAVTPETAHCPAAHNGEVAGASRNRGSELGSRRGKALCIAIEHVNSTRGQDII
jgi:hypothetical protein